MCMCGTGTVITVGHDDGIKLKGASSDIFTK